MANSATLSGPSSAARSIQLRHAHQGEAVLTDAPLVGGSRQSRASDLHCSRFPVLGNPSAYIRIYLLSRSFFLSFSFLLFEIERDRAHARRSRLVSSRPIPSTVVTNANQSDRGLCLGRALVARAKAQESLFRGSRSRSPPRRGTSGIFVFLLRLLEPRARDKRSERTPRRSEMPRSDAALEIPFTPRHDPRSQARDRASLTPFPPFGRRPSSAR